MQVGLGLLDQDELPGGLAFRSPLAELLDQDGDVQDVVEAQPVAARLVRLHGLPAEQDAQVAHDGLERRRAQAERDIEAESRASHLLHRLVYGSRDRLHRRGRFDRFVRLQRRLDQRGLFGGIDPARVDEPREGRAAHVGKVAFDVAQRMEEDDTVGLQVLQADRPRADPVAVGVPGDVREVHAGVTAAVQFPAVVVQREGIGFRGAGRERFPRRRARAEAVEDARAAVA